MPAKAKPAPERRNKPPTPPERRRFPTVAEKVRVSFTASGVSARDFIEARLKTNPEDDFPATESGAVARALEGYAVALGWKKTR